MIHRYPSLLALLWGVGVGCSPKEPRDSASLSTDDSAAAQGDSGDGDTDGVIDTLPDEGELYGTYPAAPLAAPDFQATNSDGSPRTRTDLLGHPTVVWFFPAAGTYG